LVLARRWRRFMEACCDSLMAPISTAMRHHRMLFDEELTLRHGAQGSRWSLLGNHAGYMPKIAGARVGRRVKFWLDVSYEEQQALWKQKDTFGN
jgi:hypothetical protein